MAEVLGEDGESAGPEHAEELVRGAGVLDHVVERGDAHDEVELLVLVRQRRRVGHVEPDLEAVVRRPLLRVLDRYSGQVEAGDAGAQLREVDAPFAEPAGVVEDAFALDSLAKKELVGAELRRARAASRAGGKAA